MSVTYQNAPVFHCKNDASDIQSVHDYRLVFRKYVHLAHTQYISGTTSNASSTRPIKRNVHFHKQAPPPVAARIRTLFSDTLLFIDNYGFIFPAFQTRD
jgi:hypothetical protein